MRILVCCASVGMSVLALTEPAVGAPVAIVSQDRSVHVAIPSIVDAEPDVNETVAAPDNDVFNATLDRTLNQMGETNFAFAQQNSAFGNVGNVFSVTGSGLARYSATGVSGIVFAESSFEVVFTLAESRAYTIGGTGSFPDTGSGASNFNLILTGPGGTVASFAKSDFNPNNNDGAFINTPPFGTTGTLAAGQYTLSAVAGVSGGPNAVPIMADVDFEFTATAEGDDGGGNPIALPAAVWPAGTLLLGLAATLELRRRAKSFAH